MSFGRDIAQGVAIQLGGLIMKVALIALLLGVVIGGGIWFFASLLYG